MDVIGAPADDHSDRYRRQRHTEVVMALHPGISLSRDRRARLARAGCVRFFPLHRDGRPWTWLRLAPAV